MIRKSIIHQVRILASLPIKGYAVKTLLMNDFRKPHGFGGNRGNDRFGKKNFGRPSFGRKPGGFERPGERNFGERPQMHQATCSACGNACEVPFRPNGQKPVYCSTCFNNKDRAPSGNFERRDFNRPPSPPPQQNALRDTRIDDIKKQLDAMQSKLDRILQKLEPPKAPVAAEVQEAVPAGETKKKTASKKTLKKK